MNDRLQQRRNIENSEIHKRLNQEAQIKNRPNINNEKLKNNEINYVRNTPPPNKETNKKMNIEQRKQMFENNPKIIRNSALPVKGISKEIEQRKQMFENNNNSLKNNQIISNKIMIKKGPNEQNKNENNNNTNKNINLPNREVKKEIEQKQNNNKNKNIKIIPNPSNIKKENQQNKQIMENNNPMMNDVPGIKILNKNENEKKRQISESNIQNNNPSNKKSILKNEQNKPNMENNNSIKNNQLPKKEEIKKINNQNQPINNNIHATKIQNKIINEPNQFPMNNMPTNNISGNKNEKKKPSLELNDINKNDILFNRNINNIMEKEQMKNNNIFNNKPDKLLIKTEIEKEDNKPKVENNNNTDINKKEKKFIPIIPMINKKGSNNCFINVLVQILFHSPEFRKEYLKINFNKDNNNPLYQLQNLFYKYQKFQNSETPNILDIITFRKKLSENFPDIEQGVCGDPVEVLNNILNAIHLFKVNHTNLNEYNASNFNCNLSCLSHKFFSIKLQESICCNSCEKFNEIPYDGNYFIYEIFVFEILEKIDKKSHLTFGKKLFSFCKNINTEVPPNTKINDCICEKPNIKKDLIQCGISNPYLVINLTWDNPIPKMTDVCKIYYLIPLFGTNADLFSLDIKVTKKNYNLYGIILYYNGHYTCALNINNVWYFIDDVIIKKFESYNDLITKLIYNHYHPVILFYSNYIKNTNLDKGQEFQSDDYTKLYKFCKEFDQSRGNNVSDVVSKKNSFIKKSSIKLNQAIEYVNSSKKASKLSSSTITSGEGWLCLSCKKKNKNSSIKCWCCKRVRNILPSTNDSNSFNLLKDSNINKVTSGLFLNDIPIVNSIRVNNNSNLKESIEYFFDKKNSSIEVLRSKSKKIKTDFDNENEIINNNDNVLSTIHNDTKQLQFHERKNNRMNSTRKKKEENEFSIFNKSNNFWTCKNCGNKNNSNFCPNCGNSKNNF